MKNSFFLKITALGTLSVFLCPPSLFSQPDFFERSYLAIDSALESYIGPDTRFVNTVRDLTALEVYLQELERQREGSFLSNPRRVEAAVTRYFERHAGAAERLGPTIEVRLIDTASGPATQLFLAEGLTLTLRSTFTSSSSSESAISGLGSARFRAPEGGQRLALAAGGVVLEDDGVGTGDGVESDADKFSNALRLKRLLSNRHSNNIRLRATKAIKALIDGAAPGIFDRYFGLELIKLLKASSPELRLAAIAALGVDVSAQSSTTNDDHEVQVAEALRSASWIDPDDRVKTAAEDLLKQTKFAKNLLPVVTNDEVLEAQAARLKIQIRLGRANDAVLRLYEGIWILDGYTFTKLRLIDIRDSLINLIISLDDPDLNLKDLQETLRYHAAGTLNRKRINNPGFFTGATTFSHQTLDTMMSQVMSTLRETSEWLETIAAQMDGDGMGRQVLAYTEGAVDSVGTGDGVGNHAERFRQADELIQHLSDEHTDSVRLETVQAIRTLIDGAAPGIFDRYFGLELIKLLKASSPELRLAAINALEVDVRDDSSYGESAEINIHDLQVAEALQLARWIDPDDEVNSAALSLAREKAKQGIALVPADDADLAQQRIRLNMQMQLGRANDAVLRLYEGIQSYEKKQSLADYTFTKLQLIYLRDSLVHLMLSLDDSHLRDPQGTLLYYVERFDRQHINFPFLFGAGGGSGFPDYTALGQIRDEAIRTLWETSEWLETIAAQMDGEGYIKGDGIDIETITSSPEAFPASPVMSTPTSLSVSAAHLKNPQPPADAVVARTVAPLLSRSIVYAAHASQMPRIPGTWYVELVDTEAPNTVFNALDRHLQIPRNAWQDPSTKEVRLDAVVRIADLYGLSLAFFFANGLTVDDEVEGVQVVEAAELIQDVQSFLNDAVQTRRIQDDQQRTLEAIVAAFLENQA